MLLLPALTAGAALALLDPNDLKPALAAAVERATGRALTLRGPLRLSPSLWPTVAVEDVLLANLPGGSRADMARAERIEAQLSLPALLHRRVELTKLTLIGPNILFEIVDGQPNWAFHRTEAAPGAAAPAQPGAPPVSLGIRAAVVRNGMVTFRGPARTHVVGIRSLDLRQPAAGGPLGLDSVLVYSDYQPFGFRFDAHPAHDGQGEAWDASLRLTAFDARMSATGTVRPTGEYDLAVAGDIPALQALNALLPELRLPPAQDVRLSAQLSSGPVPGGLPRFGAARLSVAGADLGGRVPGLTLGATELTLPGPGAAASITGAGRYAGQAFGFTASAVVPERLEGPVRTPVEVSLRATGPRQGSLGLSGTLALRSGAFAGWEGTAALRTPALAAWRPGLPAWTDLALDGRVALPADRRSLAVRGAKLTSQQVAMSGDATVALGPAPSVEAKLHLPRLDLDALLPAGASGTAPEALPWEALRGTIIGLSGRIGTLTAWGQTWREVDGDLHLADGRLDIGRLRATPPGGREPVDAALTADASRRAVRVSLHAPALPLALLGHAAGLPGAFEGAVRVEAKLAAAGRTLRELASSADGTASLTMVGGSLDNAALLRLASPVLERLSVDVPREGQTAVRCLALAGPLRAGVWRLDRLALDTTYLKLEGAGTIDWGTETVDLRLSPRARPLGGWMEVPVTVKGPFHALENEMTAGFFGVLRRLVENDDGSDICRKAGG